MRFKDIPGLEEEKKQLIEAVQNNHVAHAQLFLGNPGGGNLAMSLAFVAFINCEQPLPNDSCGTCSACSKIDKLIHPDVHFVFPVVVKGKNKVSADYLSDWRSFVKSHPYGELNHWYKHIDAEDKQGNISKEESRNIIKNLSLKSFEAKYKVMLIWMPELMNIAAANGILKILEEPPEGTLFLLVTNDYEKLLTTILSRTQLFKIRSFSDQEVIDHLVKEENADPAKAQLAAQLAEGNMMKAVSQLIHEEDQCEQDFQDWMRLCWKNDLTSIVELTSAFATKSKVLQKNLLQYGLAAMREGLLINHSVKEDESDGSFAQKFFSVLDLNKAIQLNTLLNDSLYYLERNSSAKIIFLDLSLKIASLLKK